METLGKEGESIRTQNRNRTEIQDRLEILEQSGTQPQILPEALGGGHPVSTPPPTGGGKRRPEMPAWHFGEALRSFPWVSHGSFVT